MCVYKRLRLCLVKEKKFKIKSKVEAREKMFFFLTIDVFICHFVFR